MSERNKPGQVGQLWEITDYICRVCLGRILVGDRPTSYGVSTSVRGRRARPQQIRRALGSSVVMRDDEVTFGGRLVRDWAPMTPGPG